MPPAAASVSFANLKLTTVGKITRATCATCGGEPALYPPSVIIMAVWSFTRPTPISKRILASPLSGSGTGLAALSFLKPKLTTSSAPFKFEPNIIQPFAFTSLIVLFSPIAKTLSLPVIVLL